MFTLTEAAALLGVAASTLRRQIHNGKLKGRLLGKTWVVTRAEVERYRRDSLRGHAARSRTAASSGPPSHSV